MQREQRYGKMDETRDFFISYNQADRDWAGWIAWEGIVNLFAQRKHIAELKRGKRGESNQEQRILRS